MVLALTNRPQQHPRPTQASVVGNPSQAQLGFVNTALSYALSALPGAEKEARRVADLLGTDAILGSTATKALVQAQMPEARIIHLAAHGLLDEERGLGSAIALVPTETDNGLLTAAEIIELSLRLSWWC
ncbi:MULTISPECIES: CHAT domain-containing protein [Cyanophyceae]|uniref:CHAT domain-containing protein n=1 Tax=unclassified Leptolyngbya TaxID=2650499 RepID=UPI001F54AF52|nr:MULTISPECIES: CHAT domain-containing protein [Cyanophyceae]